MTTQRGNGKSTYTIERLLFAIEGGIPMTSERFAILWIEHELQAKQPFIPIPRGVANTTLAALKEKEKTTWLTAADAGKS